MYVHVLLERDQRQISPELWHAVTTSHQLRGIFRIRMIAYSWQLESRDLSDLWHPINIHIRQWSDFLVNFCSSIIETWRGQDRPTWDNEHTSNQQTKDSQNNSVHLSCWEIGKSRSAECVTPNNITSTEKDFQHTSVHLLFRDVK